MSTSSTRSRRALQGSKTAATAATATKTKKNEGVIPSRTSTRRSSQDDHPDGKKISTSGVKQRSKRQAAQKAESYAEDSDSGLSDDHTPEATYTKDPSCSTKARIAPRSGKEVENRSKTKTKGKNIKSRATSDDDESHLSSSEDDDEGDKNFDGDQVDRASKKNSGSKATSDTKKGRKSKFRIPVLNSTLSDKDRAKIDKRIQMSRKFAMQAEKQSKNLSVDEVPTRASAVRKCPFCHRVMPDKPSDKLTKLMQAALDAFHNKVDMRASTATLDLCFLHHAEKVIIPEGKKNGWPKELSREKLKARARHEEIMEVMRDRIDRPTNSEWFVRLRQRSKDPDRGAQRLENMGATHAGYYGEQGQEVLHEVLTSTFLSAHEPEACYNLELLARRKDCRFAPLTASDFVDKVLMPELVCLLIKADHKKQDPTMSMTRANDIRIQSAKYGSAMFPTLDVGEAKSRRGYVYVDEMGASVDLDRLCERKGTFSRTTSLPDAKKVSNFPETSALGFFDDMGMIDEELAFGSSSTAKRKRDRLDSSSTSRVSDTRKDDLPSSSQTDSPSKRPRPRPSASRSSAIPNSSSPPSSSMDHFSSQASSVRTRDILSDATIVKCTPGDNAGNGHSGVACGSKSVKGASNVVEC